LKRENAVTLETETVRDRLAGQLALINRLRATGPNPFDYFQWADETWAALREGFGDDSPQVQDYLRAVSERGRIPGTRGLKENMTLNIYGQWGILGRLERAEVVLREALAAVEAPAEA
jgi:hypothetical protein